MSFPDSESSSRGFVRYNYDSLNSETFGSAQTTGDDWMASHDAFVSGLTSDTTSPSTEEEALSETRTQTMRIKDLWPSSPVQPSTPNDSIWSSPELPSRPPPQQTSNVIGSSSLPAGGRVMTVEELEKEYSTPPAETTPTNQPLAPPPGFRMPAPQLAPRHLIGQNPPMRLPPHLLLNPQRALPPGFPPFPLPPRQHLRGFPPPLPHQGPLLPPSAFHRPPPHPRMMAPSHNSHWPLQQSEVAPRKSRRSEYLGEMKSDGSGFMTQKEKEWVIKIQLIQLQSSDPSNEDYYYMNYMRRKQSSAGSTGYNHSNHTGQSDDQQILALPNIVHEERKYKPMEFTGALGKLSVLSLGAPRKRLDVGVAGGELGKEGGVARKKQALIVIEKLYSVLLDLEELERKALILSHEERESLVSVRDQARADVMAQLQLRQASPKSELALFHQVMTIRKGKRLIKRMLPLLSDDQAKTMVVALLQNLSIIIKKDSSDQVLPELRACVSAVVSTFDLSSVTCSLRALLEVGVSSGSGLGSTLSKLCNGSNLQEDDLEVWYQQCSELDRQLSAHSDQLIPSSPHTAALLNTLTSLSHSV